MKRRCDISELKPANRFQETFGLPVPGARNKLCNHMEERVVDFIRSSPFAVLATSDHKGVTASLTARRHIRLCALDRQTTSNATRLSGQTRLFQSYGNVDDNGHIELLFLFPAEITPYFRD